MREDYIRGLLRRLPHIKSVRHAGDRLITNCIVAPLHHRNGQDRRPSMSISYNDGLSFCHCFGCGFKGTLEAALAHLAVNLVEGPIQQAASELAVESKRLESLSFPDLKEVKLRRDRDRAVDHSKLWRDLMSTPWPTEAEDLFRSKNVDPEFARTTYGCAFIPKGYESYAFGEDAETGEPKAIHQDSVAFPTLIRQEGRTICIGAQARPVVYDNRGAKYWSLLRGFKSHRHLFGQHLCYRWFGRPIALVEGPFDTMHLAQLGVPVVGLHGLFMSPEKVARLRATKPPLLVVLLDPDVAGVTAATEVKSFLTAQQFPATIAQLQADPKYYSLEDLQTEVPELFPELQEV